jgi:hypothetical protein
MTTQKMNCKQYFGEYVKNGAESVVTSTGVGGGNDSDCLLLLLLLLIIIIIM